MYSKARDVITQGGGKKKKKNKEEKKRGKRKGKHLSSTVMHVCVPCRAARIQSAPHYSVKKKSTPQGSEGTRIQEEHCASDGAEDSCAHPVPSARGEVGTLPAIATLAEERKRTFAPCPSGLFLQIIYQFN